MAKQAMTFVALKERCKQLGCTVSGRKEELVARLQRAADLLNCCDHPKAQWRWGANGRASYAHCSLCDAKVLNIEKGTRRINRTFIIRDVLWSETIKMIIDTGCR
eukprot:1302871-Heterocapsa_arctica.AAC.1